MQKNHEKINILKKTVHAYIAPEEFDDFLEKLETQTHFKLFFVGP